MTLEHLAIISQDERETKLYCKIMTALPLDDVRRLAYQARLEEVQFNDTSRVIAFVSDENVRFNVYYTTGTVATSLLHPRQGKTQLFRRNVR